MTRKPVPEVTQENSQIYAQSRILVAAWNRDVRLFVAASLHRFGLGQVTLAENGLAAFSFLLDGIGRIGSCPFDLLIAEKDMPGKNGLELIRAVKEHRMLQRMPIILIVKNRKEKIRSSSRVHYEMISQISEPLQFGEFTKQVFIVLYGSSKREKERHVRQVGFDGR